MFDLFDDLAPGTPGTLGNKPLPSGDSAGRLVEGDVGALPTVLLHWGVRTGLVAAGLYVAGHGSEKLLVHAFGASTAIEVFVLTWAFANREKPGET